MTHILTYECPPDVHKQKCGLLMKDNRCNVERIAELEKTEAEFRFFLEIHDEVPAFAKKMRELEAELSRILALSVEEFALLKHKQKYVEESC